MSSFDEFDAFEGASLGARAMSARPTPYLDDLNPAQREAVEKLDGSVLMLAGAGTGKTKALTARMVHLMHTGRARPNEILSVTFTNKAAREMKTRMGRMMGQAVEGMPWLGTFHSICVKLLRRHAELISLPDGETASIKRSSSENGVLDAFETGPVPNPHLDKAIETHRPKGLHLKSNFTILDTDDQLRLLKQLIKAEGIDDKRWPARMLANIIDGWKNRALTPDTVPSADANAYNGRGVGLYAQYQRRLLELNAVDFGDLLLHMVTIFQTHPDILGQYQRWFRYILVDEYQDTNVAQYLWLRLLAQGHKNICCVGDDDQSIYGWRGAEVGNILRFEKDFPGAHVVRLEQNYRSTPHILGAASGVIRGNANRLGKELWTAAQEGEKVRLIGHWDGEEEARWIGDEIEAMQQGSRGMAPQDLDKIAILVRASHQMRAFEDRFLTIGLPYRVIGGPRFYERMEIRDAMAYFRLVTSPSDDLAFERIVNTPKRGLGDKAQQTIQRFARDNAVSLLDGAALAVEQGAIKGKGGKALGEFTGQLRLWGDLSQNVGNQSVIDRYVGDIFELETQVSEELCKLPELQAAYELLEVEYRGISISSLDFKHPLLVAMRAVDECELRVEQMRSQIGVFQGYIRVLNGDHVFFAEMILDESGYTEMWQNDKTPEAPGRLENLKELVKALESFENLQGFLEHVSLVMENDSDQGGAKVSIMTLHAAKGLEFPVVFLPGWEDGLFPSQRSMDESGVKGLEEERRLAYVGITRAEEVCTISFASNRRVFGQWQSQLHSRFIDELPEEHVEIVGSNSVQGKGYGGAHASVRSNVEDRAVQADVYNSPGWKRLQERSANPSVSQPSKRKSGGTIDMQAVASYMIGERVFHQKFGYGAVVAVDGDKVEVAFEKAGTKKVVSGFLNRPDDVPF